MTTGRLAMTPQDRPETPRKRRRGETLTTIVSTLALVLLLMGIGILSTFRPALEKEREFASESVQSTLSVFNDIRRAETPSARKALTAKLGRMKNEPRFGQFAMTHVLLIHSSVNYYRGEWEKESQLVRDALRALAGAELLTFISLYDDVIFEDEHKRLHELHSELGITMNPRPLMPFLDHERQALVECMDTLSNHLRPNLSISNIGVVFNVINPLITAPDCQLHTKLLPRL